MTDKQIIIEKGNQKCIFYDDDICRKGDKTRDCLNCARVEYHSLYKLNWENQERLESQLQAKEQECEELKEENFTFEQLIKEIEKYGAIEEIIQQLDQLKAENEILKEKFEIAIKNNMDKTLLRLENGDVKEELQEIREEFGIETLYCHDDNTRVHRCLDVLRLKDALTEIKEIAEGKNREFIDNDAVVLEILQKIGEVLE